MTKEEIMPPAESMKCIHKGDCEKIEGDGYIEYEVYEWKGSYQLCITGNTKAGTNNRDWRSAKKIDDAVTGRSDLTGTFLNKELNYKSLNTGGFILAALKDLGLVVKAGYKKYEHVPQSSFKSVVDQKIKEKKKINI